MILNFFKPNKWQNNEQPNEHKAKESPAEQKTAERAENICAVKGLLKMKTYKMSFHAPNSRHFVSGCFEKVA